MEDIKLMQGDCLERMKEIPDNSVDSIVTDPPYELGFMGKDWDKSGIANSVEMWREALRVLKPGGHLLAFSGSRTYHRMVCAIEDSGFEVRDQIMWLYGSGFPKSHDVSKAIDKAAGAVRETAYKPHGDNAVYGEGKGKAAGVDRTPGAILSEPAVTDAARQWQGWGTALKPAWEPICLARKPLIGTVAENVLAYGTGALNIDGCRVDTNGEKTGGSGNAKIGTAAFGDFAGNGGNETSPLGRWPANVMHDGSDEVLAGFPHTKSGKFTANEGSAARFFYCAKASKRDRGEGNTHPTVKPTDLMRYLCRLVTPPNGIVLDPFMGSGTTGVACINTNRNFIGIELDPTYFDIACKRIEEAQRQVRAGSYRKE